ncbi:hypothetical protein BGZ61DRAFT_486222 [Ilyonectria robusta]|uniref:uncharacterized protein n=1 Tax=Ilyonectria robusta TaxID=1079257 RepID=UPI001E8E2E03|nr:uncharacterized protein BGZ61DRAFT_486222 [Ilyonectria robusta]KAH8657303.1 hypothetical protein BGZ61DRAFT_486222 [Ilyonectria robusta]
MQAEAGSLHTPSVEANQTSPGSQQGIRSSFTGESWFVSYVLSTSMASPIQVHGPVERRTEKPRQGDNDNSSSLPLSGGITSLDLPQPFTISLICPILDQEGFLASVRDGSVSLALLRCVLFVASIHCPLELICQMGYNSRLDAESDLFNKAVKCSWPTVCARRQSNPQIRILKGGS